MKGMVIKQLLRDLLDSLIMNQVVMEARFMIRNLNGIDRIYKELLVDKHTTCQMST